MKKVSNDHINIHISINSDDNLKSLSDSSNYNPMWMVVQTGINAHFMSANYQWLWTMSFTLPLHHVQASYRWLYELFTSLKWTLQYKNHVYSETPQ